MTFSSSEDVLADLLGDTLAEGPEAWPFLPASHLLSRRRGAGTPACRVDTRVDPLSGKSPERRDESRRYRHECPQHVEPCEVILERFLQDLILWPIPCHFECAGVLLCPSR